MRPLRIGLILLALTGCTPTTPPPVVAVAAAKTASTVLVGVARAPLGITGVISNNGGNIISTNGGAIVPTGGGNLLAVDEGPLANATVFLGDAAGQPYPLVPAVQTDAQGRFSFPDVPVGVTVMVVAMARDEARHADATLQALARTSELGASTTVDTASSLVTLAVVQGLQSDLGAFDAATYRTATDATARQLASQDPPDLTDRAAALAKMGALAKDVGELQSALDAMRQEIQDIRASIAELKIAWASPNPRRPAPTAARASARGPPRTSSP